MKAISDFKATTGECAVWSDIHQLLLWIDIWEKKIHLTNVTDFSDRVIDVQEMIGYVAPCSNGLILAAMETCLGLYDAFSGNLVKCIPPPACMPESHRFNDGVIDPNGRLIVGTMKKSQLGKPEQSGKLYLYDGCWSVIADELWTVNGLAFSPNGKILYVSDSYVDVQSIWSMEYDALSAHAGNKRLFVNMTAYNGRPDGGAVDCEGNYWIAAVGGWGVLQFSPCGNLLRSFAAPVEKITKIAFGGSQHDRMFCTSIGANLSADANQPLAGSLFEFNPGIAGVVPPPFNIEYEDGRN